MSIKISQSLLLGLSLMISSSLFAAVKEYQLVIEEEPVNLTGKTVQRITVNGKFPAPLLEFEEGDEAVIRVKNKLKNKESSLHWHGLLLPGLMDGVPGFNGFQGIAPDQEFVYRFKIRQSGTYWYHAHSKGQEQDGLYGAFVIYPKNQAEIPAHEQTKRDYVVMLSEFHEQSGQQIMNNLKKSAEYYQNQRETLGDVFQQIKREGLKATWNDRKMWNQMRMLKTDLSDVTGYTFLVNGKTPEQNWMGQFKPNEKVRLRFINASAMSFFDVRIPQLKMTVVSADGQPVKPVAVDEFRIGAAETYDVIVEPTAEHYQIEAESIDRSGFAIGSLQNELKPVHHAIHKPISRPRALLTMEDMGHGNMQGVEHEQMNHQDHASHNMNVKKDTEHSMIGHKQHASAKVIEQGEDNHTQHSDTSSALDHMAHSNMTGHTQYKKDAKISTQQPVYGWANASTPAGHKALQYSDLKSLTPQKDIREAESELVIRLGGTMERYIWTMNGKKFNEAEPLKVKFGERIRLKFINDSMMAHPMHLHGMFMQLENGQSAIDMPNKHTVIVPPGKTVTTLLTADELGEWAIHCHLLYHMTAGMMNKLIVANVQENDVPTQDTVQEEHSHHHMTKPVEKQGDAHAHH
ncbi:copper resistance system multicopper oxidase [Acinetobacter variabilis]|uniref:copper resistance system multicopper oxidase n=1 Tax=Acinetobacter variabilis TaxID=70346 RepID=UPI00289E8966|nr:copper resistance system multicopper oxidase [Acinetobacter variabilis]